MNDLKGNRMPDGNAEQMRMIISEAVKQANELRDRHPEPRPLSNFEKLLYAGAAAFGLWMGATVYTSSVRLSVIETKVDNVNEVYADRYTGAQAKAYIEVTDRRLGRLERLHGLE